MLPSSSRFFSTSNTRDSTSIRLFDLSFTTRNRREEIPLISFNTMCFEKRIRAFGLLNRPNNSPVANANQRKPTKASKEAIRFVKLLVGEMTP